MDLTDFLTPVDKAKLPGSNWFPAYSWYHAYDFTPRIASTAGKIALMGVEPKENAGDAQLPSYQVRKHLYRMGRAEHCRHIDDLGTFFLEPSRKGLEMLAFVLSELIGSGATPLIISGSQTLTYSQYLAFSYLQRYVNLALVDSAIDFDLEESGSIGAHNYLQKILSVDPNYLFNLSMLGTQLHFTDSGTVGFFQKLHFEMIRLGDLRADMKQAEPLMRHSHFLSFDLSAIRQGDAPGQRFVSPAGLSTEEACTLARYAGLSQNLRCAGFFNYVPTLDTGGQTAHLIALLAWYFTEGFAYRIPESPSEDAADFFKYTAEMSNGSGHIVFYKSRRTDRWWMEVPIDGEEEGFYVMPCSYTDYQSASQGEIPERWWQAVKKMG